MKITVLGLGNILLRDEGVGIHVLKDLENHLPEDVEILDGGTIGLPLLTYLSDATHLVIIDAVRTDAPPGTVMLFGQEELMRGPPVRFSVHDISITDLISLLKFKYDRLKDVRLIGVVPERTGEGIGLSERVKRAVGKVEGMVKGVIEEWKSEVK